MDSGERLTHLEIQLAYQEDIIEALQRHLLELEKQLRSQDERLRWLQSQWESGLLTAGRNLRDDIPPHY